MAVGNHCPGCSIRFVSQDIVKVTENTVVKLQRVVVDVEVTDGIGTEVRTDQESVLPVPGDEGVPVASYQDVVPVTGFQGIPAG